MPQIAFLVALAAATICTPLAAGARALWGRLLDPAGDLLQKGKLATTMPPGLSRIVASVRQIIRTNVSAHSLIQVRALTASIIRHSRDKQAVKSQLSVSALVVYSLSWRIIFLFAAKNKHKANLQVNSKSTSITSWAENYSMPMPMPLFDTSSGATRNLHLKCIMRRALRMAIVMRMLSPHLSTISIDIYRFDQ